MPTNDMNCLKKSAKETKFTNCQYKAPMLSKEICKELPENYQTTTVKVIAKKIGKKRAIKNVPKGHRHMSHKVGKGKRKKKKYQENQAKLGICLTIQYFTLRRQTKLKQLLMSHSNSKKNV